MFSRAAVPSGTEEPSEPLTQLYRVVRLHPPLTRREETKLAQRIERCDPKAKERLIEHNLNVVARLASRYYAEPSWDGSPSSMEDLIQAGELALTQAVDTFDWRKQRRFSTHASGLVRTAMKRDAKATAPAVDTVHDLGRLPDLSESDPATQVIETEACRLLRSLLVGVLGLAGEVLILRCGIGGIQERTLTQVGELLDITSHEAGRLEREGLQTLEQRCPPKLAEVLGNAFLHKLQARNEPTADEPTAADVVPIRASAAASA